MDYKNTSNNKIMANGKKSFIAYVDWKDTFDALPDDKAGQLIKFIYAYVSDEDPKTDDLLINAVFANIKNTLKRDLKKWGDGAEFRKERAIKAGKASAKARQLKATKSNLLVQSSTKSTVSDSVSVSVDGNDSIFTINECRLKYLNNKKVLEAVSKNKKNRITIDEIPTRLSAFNKKLLENSVQMKPYKDYCSHFLNWHKKTVVNNKPFIKMRYV